MDQLPRQGGLMRVHRVHVPELKAGAVQVTGQPAQHLARVLRVQPGQPVLAFDGQGQEAPGTVASVSPFVVELELEEPRSGAVEAELELTLAVPLLKADKLTTVVRMGTELGVAAFQLVHTRRADVRDLGAGKLERLRRVAQEAARQSGRSVIPPVLEPVAADQLAGTVFAADPWSDVPLERLRTGSRSLTVLTGPEGGLTPEEVGENGFSLGSRILRAETAPVAVAAVLLAGR